MDGKCCIILIFFVSILGSNVNCINKAEIVFQMDKVDYDWNNDSHKQMAIDSNEYIVENNLITGIKVYGSNVYVTVPRWRRGVPATLNVLVPGNTGTPLLKPFPSWDMNKIGNCNAFQYVQSMEIDPNTGYMWIIDLGRINIRDPVSKPLNLCPPKLIILDLRTNQIVRHYDFPDEVVSHSSNFMNDIVLDYVNGHARYAYISDTSDAKLYVYDFDNNNSYHFQHETMKAQPLLLGQEDLIAAPIDGIAMSADFKFLFYSTLTDLRLFAVCTSILRNKHSIFSNNVTMLGRKMGGSDGMVCSQNSLFYAAFEQHAVAKVTIPKNGMVDFSTENTVVSNATSVIWVDTFGFNGTDLWFVANKLNYFFQSRMNFSSGEPNMFIWKVNVNEAGYLNRAMERTYYPSHPGILG
ncbi:hypothetical protein ACF0H5_015676 [Mactra antiquata]